jgi:hypothetical protein
MAILQRMIQRIGAGKWEELEELDRQWTEIENRCGYPPKTHYTYISGPHAAGTLVVERLWESFAAGEEAWNKLMADPDAAALQARTQQIVKRTHYEFLQKLG